MGHLINPIAIRLGINRIWNSSWSLYHINNYNYLVHGDFSINKFLDTLFSTYKLQFHALNILYSHCFIIRKQSCVYIYIYIFYPQYLRLKDCVLNTILKVNLDFFLNKLNDNNSLLRKMVKYHKVLVNSKRYRKYFLFYRLVIKFSNLYRSFYFKLSKRNKYLKIFNYILKFSLNILNKKNKKYLFLLLFRKNSRHNNFIFTKIKLLYKHLDYKKLYHYKFYKKFLRRRSKLKQFFIFNNKAFKNKYFKFYSYRFLKMLLNIFQKQTKNIVKFKSKTKTGGVIYLNKYNKSKLKVFRKSPQVFKDYIHTQYKGFLNRTFYNIRRFKRYYFSRYRNQNKKYNNKYNNKYFKHNNKYFKHNNKRVSDNSIVRNKKFNRSHNLNVKQQQQSYSKYKNIKYNYKNLINKSNITNSNRHSKYCYKNRLNIKNKIKKKVNIFTKKYIKRKNLKNNRFISKFNKFLIYTKYSKFYTNFLYNRYCRFQIVLKLKKKTKKKQKNVLTKLNGKGYKIYKKFNILKFYKNLMSSRIINVNKKLLSNRKFKYLRYLFLKKSYQIFLKFKNTKNVKLIQQLQHLKYSIAVLFKHKYIPKFSKFKNFPELQSLIKRLNIEYISFTKYINIKQRQKRKWKLWRGLKSIRRTRRFRSRILIILYSILIINYKKIRKFTVKKIISKLLKLDCYNKPNLHKIYMKTYKYLKTMKNSHIKNIQHILYRIAIQLVNLRDKLLTRSLDKLFIKRNLINNLKVKTFVNFMQISDFNSTLITKYISIRLKQNYKLLYIFRRIYRFFRSLLRLKFIKGYKFVCAGRFSRKERATYIWKRKGKFSLNKLSNIIDYSFKNVTLKFGTGSVKIWFSLNNVINQFKIKRLNYDRVLNKDVFIIS
jgi:ribosomal protein S3